LKVVVTGGAGFIGSHLVRRLLEQGLAVGILDDLSTGRRENLAGLERDVALVVGDIRDRAAVRSALKGAQAVFHVAALPSVPRSWDDPVTSFDVNALGTSIVVEEAVAAGAAVLVHSSSSSVYGGLLASMRSEDLELRPASPYAMSKFAAEKIALAHSHEIRVVALRYFNVFGPGQDPESQYAAVIPKFIAAARAGGTVTIHGDGHQVRDFTYVENVVDANLMALRVDSGAIAINIGCGVGHDLLELVGCLRELGLPVRVEHSVPRAGDIRHSVADITLARQCLGYEPRVGFQDGLFRTVADVNEPAASR
jgi:nucleoside-diphosphate-sugar epimerase